MLHKFLCLCAFLVATQGASLPNIGGRIIGGSAVTIYDHPYQVALLHQNPSGSFVLACGGVILRPDRILTAAQCVTGSNANQWRVRAGSSYHSGASGELVSVSRFVAHSEYTGFPSMTNDIALVFLSSQLPLKESIKLIVMPYQGQTIPVGTMANMTGWGSSYEGGPAQDILRKVTIPTVEYTRCLNAYFGYVTITSNMICAGVVGVGGQDFCHRDTGGPLVVNNVVYGIASFGYSCGNPNFPGVYTRVANFANWVNSNIN